MDFLAVSAYISKYDSKLSFKLLSLCIDAIKFVFSFVPLSLHFSSPTPQLL